MHHDTRLALLSAAIAIRAELQFHYNGATRIAHPHSLGATTEGTPVIVAWQLEGRRGDPPGWRLYSLGKMSRLARTGRRFEPMPEPPYKISGLIRTPFDTPPCHPDAALDLPPLATEQRRLRGRWLRAG